LPTEDRLEDQNYEGEGENYDSDDEIFQPEVLEPWKIFMSGVI
jgi:hypothetical protein